MHKCWYTSLNPPSPSAQQARVKSAEKRAVQSSAGSRFPIVSPLWCYGDAGFWLIPGLDRATLLVGCWQIASSILLNAHGYFVLLRGGAERPSKKSEWDTLGRRGWSGWGGEDRTWWRAWGVSVIQSDCPELSRNVSFSIELRQSINHLNAMKMNKKISIKKNTQIIRFSKTTLLYSANTLLKCKL